jgi:signal transduction histidine kinase
MATTVFPDISLTSTPRGRAIAPGLARLLQVGWVVLLLGAVALATLATPALHARYQEPCPESLCESLPRPNAQTVALLGEWGVSLQSYASVMVGIEWVALAVWIVLAALIIWKRPGDPVGLLLAYAGVVAASKAFLDAYSAVHPQGLWLNQLGLVISAITFPLVVGLFPDGRWVPGWMRWVALAAIGYGMAIVLAGSSPPPLLALLDIPLGVAPLLILAGGQVYRYRRVSDLMQRQQSKWALFGIGVLIGNIAVVSILLVFADLSRYQLLFVTLCYGAFLVMGLAITFGILRYRLFDIDVILSRTLVYGGLTAGIIAIYAIVVGGLGALLRAREDPAIALVATGVAAVAFAPLRDALQRGANRLLFGDRDDPYAVLSRLGQRLEGTLTPDETLPAIVRTMADALRLPYVAIELRGSDGPVPGASAGSPVHNVVRYPLAYQAMPIGELVVAPRGPGEAFYPNDRRLLEDLARQIGIAAHAVQLTIDLQRSRERIVTAREEERRRLRRDLHDGLGAQLAALAIQAGALRVQIETDPEQARDQAAELRTELRAAVADIRRLVHGLRPPALDELGLIGALQQRAARYGAGGIAQSGDVRGNDHPALAIEVVATEPMPPLSAAVEVAIYRIVDEALANVARHAAARTVVVRLMVDDHVRLTIDDDGIGLPEDRVAGVGLISMRERAEELGGSFTIAPRADAAGTRVDVTLPVPVYPQGAKT